MRLVAAAAAALAMASAVPLAPASAQSSAPALAPGELLVELGAIGVARARADLATLVVSMTGEGATIEAAQADLRARAERLAAAVRRAGGSAVTVSQIDPVPSLGLRTFDVVEEPPPAGNETVSPPGPPAARREISMGSITILLTDVSRVGAVRDAIEGVNGTDLSVPPVYALRDDRSARQSARARALASVRSDAEDYARSLDMRVVRMVRVTERTGADLLPQLASDPTIFRQAFSPQRGDPDLTVFVALGADFVLAPR